MDHSNIPDLKLKQMMFETEALKRKLGYIMAENVHTKNRLAEVLTQKFDISMLEKIEEFHNQFLKQDELITILRHELSEFENLLNKEITKDGEVLSKVKVKMHKLREHIINSELEFDKLKSSFNNYLSSY